MGKQLKKKIFITVISLLVGFSASMHVSAKFLVDEDFDSANNPENANGGNEDSAFPANTARNIQVLPVPDVINSVKISWSLSAGSGNVFIVGRTTEIPSNETTALSALSIKVVQPGETLEVIDRNIPEGKYYYVILSKDKISQKKIELYPNDNYITNPVVISKKLGNLTLLPKVEDIRATALSGGSAAITWTPLNLQNVIYTVYRGTEPLSAPASIEKAVKAGIVKDSDSFYDSLIDKSGSYYYAVTTSDTVRNEDRNLLPDRSYTSSSVAVNVEKRTVPGNIRITQEKKVGNRVEWSGIPNFEGEYLVYRSDSVIDTEAKLDKAYLAGNVDGMISVFIDRNSTDAEKFYAVITKDKTGKLNKELSRDMNYNGLPFAAETAAEVKNLTANAVSDGKVAVSWTYSGKGGQGKYRLYRSEKQTADKAEVRKFSFLSDVDPAAAAYTDTVPANASFYYYLVPPDFETDAGFKLEKGISYTSDPVSAAAEKKDAYRLRLISASLLNGGVSVTWKFSGSSGDSRYALYRSEKMISSVKVLDSSFLVDETDFSAGSYTDDAVPAGKYYYALVPVNYKSLKDFRLLKGINYTTAAVNIKSEITEEPEDSTKYSVPLKQNIYIPADLDDILKSYFYRGRYDDSIVFLKQYVISAADSKNRAVAEFYIGRCYAAKRNYREALKYFMNSEVREFLPEDALFWQDYCLTRSGR